MSMQMPVLETDRLRIRPPQMDDLPVIQQMLVDAGWAEDTDAALAGTRTWLEWATRNHQALANLGQPPYGDRVIVRKDDDAVIGQVGMVPTLNPWGVLPYYRDRLGISHEFAFPEVGLFWILRGPQQGRGYATEAVQRLIDYLFTALHLHRVIAATEDDNIASQRVMTRLGMTLTRNPRQADMPWLQTVGILENPKIHQSKSTSEDNQQ